MVERGVRTHRKFVITLPATLRSPQPAEEIGRSLKQRLLAALMTALPSASSRLLLLLCHAAAVVATTAWVERQLANCEKGRT